MAMTEEEVKKVAKAAVMETLLLMGCDVSNPEAVTEMQADFKHVRVWRKSVEAVQRQAIFSTIGVFISGVAGALYLALHR